MVGNSYSDSRTDLFLVSVYFVDRGISKKYIIIQIILMFFSPQKCCKNEVDVPQRGQWFYDRCMSCLPII